MFSFNLFTSILRHRIAIRSTVGISGLVLISGAHTRTDERDSSETHCTEEIRRAPIISAFARPSVHQVVHTIASTSLLMTMTLSPYARFIRARTSRFATLAGPEIDSQRALAVPGTVGRYSSVFTVERARSSFGRRFLATRALLRKLLSSAHNEGRRSKLRIFGSGPKN